MFEKQLAHLAGLYGMRLDALVAGIDTTRAEESNVFLPAIKRSRVVKKRHNLIVRSIRGRNTSKYMPHQGKRECQRRVRQGLAPAAL